MDRQSLLQTVGRRRFVSLSALEGVLTELKEAEVLKPDISLPSRRSIKRARDDHAAQVETDMGGLLQKITVQLRDPLENKELWYIHPGALLQHMSRQCNGFATFLKDVLRRQPCSLVSKYNIVVYSDEVSPGNQLKHDNKRKLQAIYWSIKEFGPKALAKEECWFILTAVRSNVVTRLSDGMSELMAKLTQLFFTEPYSLFSNGLNIRFHDNSFTTLYATVGIMVSDEAALKAAMGFKGASGSKICALCQNVTSHQARLHAHDASAFLIPSTETDISKFALITNDIVFETVDMLHHEQARVSTAGLKRLQQATGFNYKPQGLLMCQQLRPMIKPASMLMYDWMHVYMVSGAFNHECGLLLGTLQHEARIGYKDIHEFVKQFVWPKRMSVTGKTVFEKRSGSGELKCSASEGLSVYSVFRQYLHTATLTSNSRVREAVDCYFALCDVLDLLRRVIQGSVTSVELHAAIQNHLEKYKRTYGVDEWFPKLHYALHLGMMLEQHGCLISCFVHERKHKELKRTANNLQNTSATFEKTILQDCLYTQTKSLDDSNFIFVGPHLVSPRPASTDLIALLSELSDDQAEIHTARDIMHSDGRIASQGDVVVYDDGGTDCVGQAVFHVSIDQVCYSCIRPWRSLGHNRFDASATSAALVQSSSVKESLVYRLIHDQAFVIPP